MNGGGARVVLEHGEETEWRPRSRAGLFETSLFALSMLRMCSTYGRELVDEDSVLRDGCLETTSTIRQSVFGAKKIERDTSQK